MHDFPSHFDNFLFACVAALTTELVPLLFDCHLYATPYVRRVILFVEVLALRFWLTHICIKDPVCIILTAMVPLAVTLAISATSLLIFEFYCLFRDRNFTLAGIVLTVFFVITSLASVRLGGVNFPPSPIATAAVSWMRFVIEISTGVALLWEYVKCTVTELTDDSILDELLRPVDIPADEICAICSADFTDATELPCRHIYCKRCIRRSLKERSTCPLCSRSYSDLVPAIILLQDYATGD